MNGSQRRLKLAPLATTFVGNLSFVKPRDRQVTSNESASESPGSSSRSSAQIR